MTYTQLQTQAAKEAAKPRAIVGKEAIAALSEIAGSIK